ncbi:MAG: hypothetical protein Marn2KO_36870 [Marinobacter nauticus]
MSFKDRRTQSAGSHGIVEHSDVLPTETDSPYEEYADIRPLTPSEQSYAALHYLSEQLDQRLLVPYLRDEQGNSLGAAPECIITIQSSGRCKGFMARAVWSDPHGRFLDQITLVFEQHGQGDLLDLASTLAHEKIHAVQQQKGSPGQGNYHNRQFSNWMKSIGLQTSKTGKPGGAEIGTGMSDYPIPGGPFERVMNEILEQGFRFPFEAARALSDPADPDEGADGVADDADMGPKDPSKVKFTCPSCGLKARAKHSALLHCGGHACGLARMVPEYPYHGGVPDAS